jgi:hypothetical protein
MGALLPVRRFGDKRCAIEQRRLSAVKTDVIEDRAMEHAQTGLLTLKPGRAAHGSALESATLFVENHCQKRLVDLDVAVVFDEAQSSELVHEEAHACASRTDHFCQHLL